MRIGIDGRGYQESLDGIGRYTLNLVSGLLELDQENEYVIFVLPKTDWSFISKYPNARTFKFAHPPLSLATIHKLGPLVDREGVDLFHSLFFIAPLKMQAKLVITVHDLMALTYPRFFSERFLMAEILAWLYHRIYVPRSIQQADAVVAVSDFTRKQLRECMKVPAEKITVIHNMVAPHFKTQHNPQEDITILKKYGLAAGYLLYVGNTKPYKNIEGLFQGYARYQPKEKNAKVPLILVGKQDRFRKRVMLVAKALKVNNQIRFLEEVVDEDLPALMRGALTLVQPSHVEGFGLPALEALACGTPVVASQASVLSEVLGRSAIQFPADDSTKLGECINKLVRDPEMRAKLRKEGIQRASNFRKKKIAEKMVQFYRKVASSRS